MDVMALEDLSGVVVAKSGRGGAGDIEKEIHANGEIRGIEEASIVLLDELADAVDFFVPAGRADDHILAGFDASLDIRENAVRRGEIDDRVNIMKFVGGEGGGVNVFLAAHDANVMPALACDFRDKRAGFASA